MAPPFPEEEDTPKASFCFPPALVLRIACCGGGRETSGFFLCKGSLPLTLYLFPSASQRSPPSRQVTVGKDIEDAMEKQKKEANKAPKPAAA